jgi:hypothetical protein
MVAGKTTNNTVLASSQTSMDSKETVNGKMAQDQDGLDHLMMENTIT